jgi:hypothetical protein
MSEYYSPYAGEQYQFGSKQAPHMGEPFLSHSVGQNWLADILRKYRSKSVYGGEQANAEQDVPIYNFDPGMSLTRAEERFKASQQQSTNPTSFYNTMLAQLGPVSKLHLPQTNSSNAARYGYQPMTAEGKPLHIPGWSNAFHQDYGTYNAPIDPEISNKTAGVGGGVGDSAPKSEKKEEKKPQAKS